MLSSVLNSPRAIQVNIQIIRTFTKLREMIAGYITDGVSILQTEFSNREGHQTRRVGLEAMPLDQDIESRHGEREPGLEIRPHAVHDLLEGEQGDAGGNLKTPIR